MKTTSSKNQRAPRRKVSEVKRATLADVARLSGVGPMTVSRTINGHPYVTEETATKVRAAIRQLSYRPNHAARILTGQRSRSIGLIVPDISDSFFSIISQAAQETARAHGYLLWLAASGEDAGIEASQVEMMLTFGVDGILLVPSDSGKASLKALVAASAPVVTIDRAIESAKTSSVEVENRAGAVLAVDHLIQHGHKQIACIVTNPHLITISERVAGYQDSMRRAKLRPRKEIHLPDQASARPALAKLFHSRNPPRALFTANNITTMWVLEALRELKIKVGKDVALVGFDDVDFFSHLTPGVTAIRQPIVEMGTLAAEILLTSLQTEAAPRLVRSVLPTTLVIRESCGCKARELAV